METQQDIQKIRRQLLGIKKGKIVIYHTRTNEKSDVKKTDEEQKLFNFARKLYDSGRLNLFQKVKSENSQGHQVTEFMAIGVS